MYIEFIFQSGPMINFNISFLLQLTKTAESADSDEKTFSSYVEMLKQKGHVMDSSSTLHNMVKSCVIFHKSR